MFIEKLLQLMSEKKASDIFISSGSPIMIKIQGNMMPVNPQVMDGETTKKIIYEMLTPAQIATFEKDLELNLSKPMPGIGNFRVNVFWQKGSIASVIRFITAEIPKLEDLNLPPVLLQLVMEKRGLVLVVGATGSGKSTTLASMLDFRNQRTRSSTSSRRRSASSTSARWATTPTPSTTRCETPCARRPTASSSARSATRRRCAWRSPMRFPGTCASPRCTPTTPTRR